VKISGAALKTYLVFQRRMDQRGPRRVVRRFPRDVGSQPISPKMLLGQARAATKDAAALFLCALCSRSHMLCSRSHIMQPMPKPDDEYDDAEATRRMNEALRRALNTPPTRQAMVRRPRKKAKTIAADQAPPKCGGDASA
jgi:hypothetical protein